jgi:hypothetical protein
MIPSKLRTTLATAFKHNCKILIKGAPGIGKSEIVEAAAAEHDMPVVLMHPAISDPTDFKGLPSLTPTGAEFLPYGNLRALIEADRPTVCFMDDIGQAPHAVQAALMQLIQARRIDGVAISNHVLFVGATNDSTHMAGVNSLLEPVKSRWHSILTLEADMDDWVFWASNNNIAPEVIAFIRFRGLSSLHNFVPTRAIENSPSPRTVAAASKLYRAGLDQMEVIAGATGNGWAAEFMAFLACWKNMPNPDHCLKNPDTAPTPSPSDVSTCYAIAVAISLRLNVNNIGNGITYLARMASEFSILAIKDAHRRDKEITQSQPFVQWALKNGHLLA